MTKSITVWSTMTTCARLILTGPRITVPNSADSVSNVSFIYSAAVTLKKYVIVKSSFHNEVPPIRPAKGGLVSNLSN